MAKISSTIRIDEKLKVRADELWKANKESYKHPASYTAVVTTAMAEYLEREEAKAAK